MDKAEVAEVLEDIGILLQLKGESPFKTRAYENGARLLTDLDEDLQTLIDEKRLGELKGFGDALVQKVTELVTTGKLTYYEDLKASIPAGLIAMTEIPGLGPKRARAIHEKLGVDSLPTLEAACQDGRVAGLSGFGVKSAQKILEGLEQLRTYAKQHRHCDVQALAFALVEQLREVPEVLRISLAGSIRRGKEVLKDIDIVASSSQPEAVMDAFAHLDGVAKVTGHGTTKSSVLLTSGIGCDLRVVPDKQFPYALLHFTGSKEHNVALRQRAIAQEKKVSEWGLFDTTNLKDKEDDGTLIVCHTEEEIYDALGLQFIPPELREDRGEIGAAENNDIPRLVEWTQLRGTFHCHTTASDGRNTLEEMVDTARELGFDYLGLTDHSLSSFQAKGLSPEQLATQIKQVHELNETLDDIHLFAGSEVDILKDGSLDFEDSLLAQLDFAIASVHNAMGMDEATMTKRVCRAMENPYITMLGHATGRRLLVREPFPINMEAVIDCAAETGTWIELNANGYRLDMDWRHWHRARDKGVKTSINPDAHRLSDFAFLRLGTQIARKGWLRPQDVMNTLPLEKIKQALRKKREH